MQLSKFLRAVLVLDSASCLGMAAIVLPFSEALQPALGVEAGTLSLAAAALIPIGLYMLWLGTRREAAPGLVWLVIAGNVGWTAASLAAATSPGITSLGEFAIAGQGLAVLAIAIAEWVGLRTSQAQSLRTA